MGGIERVFVGAIGGVIAAFNAVPAAAQVSHEEAANRQLVADFCAAWSARNLDKGFPYLADDSVYWMSETTPAVVGPAGVRERLGSWLETSDTIEFKILETFARGLMVINHRIDRFASKTRPLTWEGVGVFFVKDGKIKEWSDYTIRVQRS
jgi:limonene-1,2-epoxide hydrolase